MLGEQKFAYHSHYKNGNNNVIHEHVCHPISHESGADLDGAQRQSCRLRNQGARVKIRVLISLETFVKDRPRLEGDGVTHTLLASRAHLWRVYDDGDAWANSGSLKGAAVLGACQVIAAHIELSHVLSIVNRIRRSHMGNTYGTALQFDDAST